MVAVRPRLEIMTVPTGQTASCVVDMHACCFLHSKCKLNSPVYDIVYVSMYLVFVYIKSVYLITQILCTFFFIHVNCLAFSSVSWESLPWSQGGRLPGMTTVKSIASSIPSLMIIVAMICIIISD